MLGFWVFVVSSRNGSCHRDDMWCPRMMWAACRMATAMWWGCGPSTNQGLTVVLYDSHCHDPLVKADSKLVIAGLAISNGYHAYANMSCLMAWVDEAE